MTPTLSTSDAALLEATSDPIAYIERFLVIRHMDTDALIPFILNAEQRKIMAIKTRAIAAGKLPRFIILKHRRPGVTTLEQALNFHMAATQTNRRPVTLAHDSESTEEIFSISQLFYRQLPEEFRPHRLGRTNKRDLNFDQLNSRFYIGTAGNETFGSGATLSRVHWSEVAKSPGSYDSQRQLLLSLTEAARSGEIVLESTPKGMGGLFHEVWTEASKGDTEWTPIFLAWWEDDRNQLELDPDGREEVLDTLTDRERHLAETKGVTPEQLAWYRWKARQPEMKGGLILQDYPDDPSTCFLVSGQTWMDMQIVGALLEALEEPLEVRDSGALTIFRKPTSGGDYIAASDVGEGLPDSDYSVTVILDRRTMEQCAVLRGRWGPREFARRSVKLCETYNRALWAVERNNHGHSVLNTAENELAYPNLYYHQDYDASGSSAMQLGFPTNLKTRPQMLDLVKEATEEGHMRVRDRVFLEEARTFVRQKDGKYRAREEKGCHDDVFIAWSIALHVRDSSPKRAPDGPTPTEVTGLGTTSFRRPAGSLFPRR